MDLKEVIREHKVLLIILIVIGLACLYQSGGFKLNQTLNSISYPLVDENENTKTYMFSIYADNSICQKTEYPLRVGLSYDYEQKPVITKTKYNYRGNNMGIDCKIFFIDGKFEPRCNVDQNKLIDMCNCPSGINPPNEECQIKESCLGSLGNLYVTAEKGVETVQPTTIIGILGALGILGILLV